MGMPRGASRLAEYATRLVNTMFIDGHDAQMQIYEDPARYLKAPMGI